MPKRLPLSILLALTACRSPSDPASGNPPQVTPGWTALLVGGSVRVTASVSVRWSSDNPTIASVDDTGLVRAHALGRATITASRDVAGARAVATIVVAPPVLVGAGDIANCGANDDDEATAKLLDSLPGVVFTAGDNAYMNGTPQEFLDCYQPTWGRHKWRTRPAPGNHEYNTPGATGYYAYFGPLAGDSGVGYFSFDFAGWHIISLNSNVPMVAGSAQEQWLRSDLSLHPVPCTLAYWHHPRFSSGMHGSSTGSQPLWQALYDAQADVVIVGHDHTYERFAPQTPVGTPDAANGIREFVVGTGGAGLYAFPAIAANSEFRDNTTHGVLKLTLAATGYDWELISTVGTVIDAGTASCH